MTLLPADDEPDDDVLAWLRESWMRTVVTPVNWSQTLVVADVQPDLSMYDMAAFERIHADLMASIERSMLLPARHLVEGGATSAREKAWSHMQRYLAMDVAAADFYRKPKRDRTAEENERKRKLFAHMYGVNTEGT